MIEHCAPQVRVMSIGSNRLDARPENYEEMCYTLHMLRHRLRCSAVRKLMWRAHPTVCTEIIGVPPNGVSFAHSFESVSAVSRTY